MSEDNADQLQQIAKPSPEPEIRPTQTPSNDSIPKDDARAALEAIAKPASPEQKSQQIDQVLSESSQTYIDQGDRRVIITALARAAGDTPLGLEFKRDTLTMIDPKHEDLIPKSETNQFAAFLEEYNKAHPGAEVSGEGTPETIAHAISQNSAFSEGLWKELAADKPRPNLTTPDGLIEATGIHKTPENQTKVEKLYKPIRMKKDINLGEYAMPALLGGAMLLSVLTQIGMTGTAGGGQEH